MAQSIERSSRYREVTGTNPVADIFAVTVSIFHHVMECRNNNGDCAGIGISADHIWILKSAFILAELFANDARKSGEEARR